MITSRHVLTAAHCITSTLYAIRDIMKLFFLKFSTNFCFCSYQRSIARLGEHDISSTTDGSTEDINIIRSERHPNYDRRDGTSDIAVLYLEHDAELSSEII